MKNKGFNYHITLKRIREYQKIPLIKRVLWLYQGNLLRKAYPKNIIRLQNKFRNGEI
jgi:hypothetical protein